MKLTWAGVLVTISLLTDVPRTCLNRLTYASGQDSFVQDHFDYWNLFHQEDISLGLINAVISGDSTKVRSLLSRGANINAKDKSGRTPLMHASRYGRADIVNILLHNSADVNTRDETGASALMLATSSEHPDIVKELLAQGAHVNDKNYQEETALMLAPDNKEIVEILVRRGAGVNMVSKRGWTPLMYAAFNGHLAKVQILLYRGADRFTKTLDGQTALTLASQQGHQAIVEILQQNQPRKAETISTDTSLVTAQIKLGEGKIFNIRGSATFTIIAVHPDDLITGTFVYTIPEEARQKIVQITGQPFDAVPSSLIIKGFEAIPVKKPSCPELRLEFEAMDPKISGVKMHFDNFVLTLRETPLEVSRLLCKWADRLREGRGHARDLTGQINRLLKGEK